MMMITICFFCQGIVMVIKQRVKTGSFYFEVNVWKDVLLICEIIAISSDLKFDNDKQLRFSCCLISYQLT